MSALLTVALSALTAFGAQAPEPTAADAERGIALASSGDCDGALPLLDAALAAAPDDVLALRWRGHCRNLLGDYASALVDYDRALRLDDADAWTHYARGMSLHNLARYDEALASYGAALERDSAYLKAVQWRGHTRTLVGDFGGAVRDFDRALELAPGDHWTLSSRGRAHARARDFAAAALDFDRALFVWPEDAVNFACLGFARVLAEREVAPARHAFERAIALDPAGSAHAALWRWWLDGTEGADRELRAWLAARGGAAPTGEDWDGALVRFALGDTERAALEARVDAAPQAERAGLACELAFYAGVARAKDGATVDALWAFTAALATGAVEKWEWEGGRRGLRRVAERVGASAALDFEVARDGDGVRVTALAVGGLAQAAGLRVGDRVALSAESLIDLTSAAGVGGVVELPIERGGSTAALELVVGAGG